MHVLVHVALEFARPWIRSLDEARQPQKISTPRTDPIDLIDPIDPVAPY